MGYKDLREFIRLSEKTGDVVYIKKEVDWDGEEKSQHSFKLVL
jgi:3-polyprenyl-4-hydroxybenzoate decarboxylase